MKILHVLHQFPDEPAGGTERNVRAVALAMRALGHEVVVVAGSLEVGAPSRPVERLVDGIRVIELRRDDLYFESWEKAWCPGVGDAFTALLKRERPDVVHVQHWIRLTTDLVRLARAAGVEVVACTLHDHWSMLATPVRRVRDTTPDAPPAPRWMGEAERREAFAFHRSDLVDELRAAHVRFAPSAAHAASVQSVAPHEFGAVLPIPTPLLEVPPRLAEPTGVRGRRLAYWGSLYAEKGIELLVDALQSIGSGWSLDVYGAAPDAAFEATLRRRTSAFPIRFHGAFRVADLGRIEADYAVFPASSHESYGLVLDEAACLGLPMLAADLPAFRERATTDVCAFFAADDPGSLAMLLCDEPRLAKLQRPKPWHSTPADAAAALLDGYAAARSGASRPFQGQPLLGPRARARVLFRRAERRLWSALQGGEPKLPPDAFLGG